MRDFLKEKYKKKKENIKTMNLLQRIREWINRPFYKRSRKRIVVSILYCIIVGALLGWSGVQLFMTKNILWFFVMLPGIVHLILAERNILIAKKNIKKIEAEFKEKHGVDMKTFIEKMGK